MGKQYSQRRVLKFMRVYAEMYDELGVYNDGYEAFSRERKEKLLGKIKRYVAMVPPEIRRNLKMDWRNDKGLEKVIKFLENNLETDKHRSPDFLGAIGFV
jgi:hypothetical protein